MKKSTRPHRTPLIVIVGATGTGKSALAVTLAKRFGGEVISADSRQVYRGLDIGTGKLTAREMRGIPHHLINTAPLTRTYTAAHFKRDAEKTIHAIWKRGKVPILCGGTGFYIRAVVDGIAIPGVPPNRELRRALARKTIKELFRMLKKKDPARARDIDRHNPRRLMRALEVAHALGKVPRMKANPIDARVLMLGLALPKEELEKRTRARIRSWLRRGLLAEVRQVPLSRMNELGLVYRWAARLADKEIMRNAFIDGLTRDLMKYAKRQMTWFKRDPHTHWVRTKAEAVSLTKRFLE